MTVNGLAFGRNDSERVAIRSKWHSVGMTGLGVLRFVISSGHAVSFVISSEVYPVSCHFERSERK